MGESSPRRMHYDAVSAIIARCALRAGRCSSLDEDLLALLCVVNADL